ncbi:MAG: extracellular solute-binding protein [Hyphomicrobiaceae bacterium]
MLFAVIPAIAQVEQPSRESPQVVVTPGNPTPSVATADVTSTTSVPVKPAPVTATGSETPTAEKSEPSKASPSRSQEASPEKAAPAPTKPSKPRIVVVSWAGAYGDAQKKAIIDPLSRDLDIDIERRTHGKSASAIDADVMEQDQSTLIAACAAGRLVKIGSLLSPAERSEIATTDAGGDFLANSVSDCGVPTFAWSSMLIANGEAMKKLAKRRYREPTRLANLLDVKRFPGRRALIRNPKRLLEMMLMGTGVERKDVYAVLSTRQGQDVAFEALDRLSKHVLWVDGPREALLALDQAGVTMAMTFSGRAFRRLIATRLQPIWDGHVIDFAAWAVPKTAPNRDAAKRFILAATRADRLAAQARIWPYGPMRRSALPLARRHDLLDADLDAFMPTSELRLAQGLVLDAAFWAEHGAALQMRFDDWLAGIPLGIRVPVPVKAPPAPLPPLPKRGAAGTDDAVR